MKLGILGTAEIALRRFLPALSQCPAFQYGGVATRTHEKGIPFQEGYGGKIYDSYDALLEDPSIEAVYVPLPPALHYEWGRKVLLSGKHLLLEKPFTTSTAETEKLLALAEEKHLAVHENYMFLYHSQLAWIREQLAAGIVGDLRLIRCSFGFPFRGKQDFRYDKALGGGALLDCGGYPVRLAAELLGEDTFVTWAQLQQGRDFDVDLYGNACLQNGKGMTAQIAFGMDNSYICSLELWGSRGILTAPRIFTAPAGFPVQLELKTQEGTKSISLLPDDSFLHSIEKFRQLISQEATRESHEKTILQQAKLVDSIRGVN